MKRYDARLGYGPEDEPICVVATKDDGRLVLHTDYATLEARCAGLERERDDLLAAMRSNDPIQAANCRVLEYHQLKGECDRLERDFNAASICAENLTKERDALQAKLAAAEEALRNIPASYDPDCDCTECSEFRTRVSAILAGHAPATPQTDRKRVWVGPGHLESTGYIDQPATKGEGDE